ncbi:MAG: radical SAM family heme chaperone HemW [Prevotella sp.]|nr:radical SAM family heme chaperone HemW [Prevotella sp.]MBR1463301.1 radical SAM family heme chaperone HemW [Prevotella sp.]
MTGLYIHIPFCKSRCIYCGFYSTTMGEMKDAYVDALCQEMKMRKSDDEIATIYLGGGTPSQLSPTQLQYIYNIINKVYHVSDDAEITMECNPDDITPEYAQLIRELPINRVSMGAQTFNDETLRFLRRRHTSQQVKEAVSLLRNAGINNISIDLMFGFPNETLEEWQNDIREALNLNVEHISAYSLMYEEGTPLLRMMQQEEGKEDCKLHIIKEETSLAMYEELINRLTAAGFTHYEISNFGKIRSRHNSSYWQRLPYIGIGAAAHSYDQISRWWNVADVKKYIQLVNQGILPTDERELLDLETQYNDMVTTALRTCEGISLTLVKDLFGMEYHEYLLKNAEKSIARHLLEITGDHIHLTREGLFISDDIMSDLIHV